MNLTTRIPLYFLLATLVANVHAQDVTAEKAAGNAPASAYTIDALRERYPADSIQSADAATAALNDVQDARTRIDERYAMEQKACYPKFFTTSCLDKATERRRADLAAIRPIEVEANAYTRKAKVVERDRKLAEKAAQNEADAADRAQQGEQRSIIMQDRQQTKERQAVGKEAQRQKRAEEGARKVEQHAIKEQQRQAQESAKADERAVNVQKYDEKAREAAQRQKEVAQKKADREKDRAAKAAKAAKDADTQSGTASGTQ